MSELIDCLLYRACLCVYPMDKIKQAKLLVALLCVIYLDSYYTIKGQQ